MPRWALSRDRKADVQEESGSAEPGVWSPVAGKPGRAILLESEESTYWTLWFIHKNILAIIYLNLVKSIRFELIRSTLSTLGEALVASPECRRLCAPSPHPRRPPPQELSLENQFEVGLFLSINSYLRLLLCSLLTQIIVCS